MTPSDAGDLFDRRQHVREWLGKQPQNRDTALMELQAVTTTGIYCRADCVAQPAARNVTRIRSKVEAEASGFRACLRCRPDRTAEPVAGFHDSGPVGHAVVLISEGFLDRGSEAELAQRVGYSARQLRRAFSDAIGATPTAVARSQRTHFARRLLDETDLRITDVAFAAGFSSVRQMNRDVRAVFAFAPSELRAKRRVGDVAATDGGLSLRVPIRGIYDFEATMAFLAPRLVPGVATIAASGEPAEAAPDHPDSGENGSAGRSLVLRRTIAVCGHHGMIEVAPGPASDPALDAAGGISSLLVTVHLPTFASILDDVARVRALFAIELDPAPAVSHLAGDPLLGPLVARRPGLRMPGCWDRFETAVRIIVGQHISVAAATTVTGRIAERFGAEVSIPEQPALRRVFPSASTLAQVEAGDVAELGLPKTRARAIVALARAVDADAMDLTAGDALRPALLELPGIGPWTADLISLRVSQDPDAFAPGDLGLRHAIRDLDVARAEPPSEAELAALATAWSPHRGTAAIHLWQRSLDAPPLEQRPLDTGSIAKQ